MSLTDDLHVEAVKARTRRCQVCEWYRNLEPEDQASFDEWAADPNASMTALWRAATKNGLSCWRGKVYDHIQEKHVAG